MHQRKIFFAVIIRHIVGITTQALSDERNERKNKK